jgi:hypothetical protein
MRKTGGGNSAVKVEPREMQRTARQKRSQNAASAQPERGRSPTAGATAAATPRHTPEFNRNQCRNGIAAARRSAK